MSGTTSDTAALPRNIAEFLVRSEIGYRVVAHASLSAPVRGPDDVARLLPIAIDRIAKTLFVVGGIDRTSSALVVVPVRDNVELAVTATAMGSHWPPAPSCPNESGSSHSGSPPSRHHTASPSSSTCGWRAGRPYSWGRGCPVSRSRSIRPTWCARRAQSWRASGSTDDPR